MNILEKLKETFLSIFPIMGIVLLLGLFICQDVTEPFWLGRFLLGGVFLILGLTIFLLGVDIGITPIGEFCGASLVKRRSLILLLVISFVIGFIVTIAEPDIQVFATQVNDVFCEVNRSRLTYSIAIGVALFMSLGILRMVVKLPLKAMLFLSYALLLVVSCFVPTEFIGVAFDSGGATTGPMTVPFIMAIGLGVAAVRKDNDSSFGLTGIASIGPILAILCYSLTLGNNCVTESLCGSVGDSATSALVAGGEESFFNSFQECFEDVRKEAFLSIMPLFCMFLGFRAFLFKISARQFTRICIGFVYAFFGLLIFLVGVHGGFMQAGAILGEVLNNIAHTKGTFFWPVALGFIFGAIIVCAEPAVWVLSDQVESITGGVIKRKVLLIFLSLGTALAIGMAMLRALIGFPLWYILLPGYAIAMILLLWVPTLFAGIAFDSGGVASGPLTSTFVLSFTLGAATGANSENDIFGVIALVAMMPLIAIQLMGVLYEYKKRKVLNEA